MTQPIAEPFDRQPLRILMADGSVRSMSPVDPEKLKKMITRNGGEPIE
ncbi:hypothetical protein [Novipirellula artificiosorum]|nr:hypothetical protein [Novipirellula artificiosorum]